jgi:hypothetical protein
MRPHSRSSMPPSEILDIHTRLEEASHTLARSSTHVDELLAYKLVPKDSSAYR